MKNLKQLVTGGLVLGMIGIAAPRGEAAPIVLSDGNSIAVIETTGTPGAVGMQDWVVDGVDHLFQQWFWYRIGASGGEAPVNALTGLSVTTSGTDEATVTYQNSALKVEVRYSLSGGSPGSESSFISERIRLFNLTGNGMQLHFFQYSDFDLDASAGNDSIYVVPGQYRAIQSDPVGVVSEIVGTTAGSPAPNYFSAGLYPSTFNSLNDGSPTQLNDNASAGPGDVTWAFQWDLNLPTGSGSYVQINKTKAIGVPEPASLVLFGMSLLGVAGVARRRKVLGVPQA